MERGNILFIAVIAAALGFFALRFVSGSPTTTRSETARPHAALDGHGGLGTPGHGERRGSFGRVDRPGRTGAARNSVEGTQFARDGRSGGRGVSRPGRGSAQSILGTDVSRGGSFGTSSSRRIIGGTGGVGIVDTHRDGGLGGSVGSGRQGREDLVQALAEQPPTANTLFGNGPEDASDEDVVLKVDSTEDTAKATESTDVREPRYGENGVELTPDSVLAFPDAGNVKGDAGTISLDFTNNWAGADESNNTLIQIREPNQWNDRFELVKNGKYLRFIITDNSGVERDISYMIDSWAPGERHQVTPTWGDGEMRLYVDGNLVGRNSYPGSLEIRPGTPMQLGSAFANYKGFDGVIHKTTVWGQAKTGDEVASGF